MQKSVVSLEAQQKQSWCDSESLRWPKRANFDDVGSAGSWRQPEFSEIRESLHRNPSSAQKGLGLGSVQGHSQAWPCKGSRVWCTDKHRLNRSVLRWFISVSPQTVTKWEQNISESISESSKKIGKRPKSTSDTDWSELHLSNSQNDGSEGAQRWVSGDFWQ